MSGENGVRGGEHASDLGEGAARFAYASADKRRQVVLDILCREGRAEITDLQKALGVSEMTIRRTLNGMAAEGLLRRVHGGAVLDAVWDKERTFRLRKVERLEVKGKLAEQAVSLLGETQSVYLDGGTTCYEIAKRIPIDHNLTIITDSVAIMLELRERRGVSVILLGGQLAGDGNTMDGMLAFDNAEHFNVDWCLFSICGFTSESLANPGMVGTQTKKIMIRRARRAVCVADSMKCGRHGLFELCRWPEVDMLLCDSHLPDDVAGKIESQGTGVSLVTAP